MEKEIKIKKILNDLRDDCEESIKINGFTFTLANYWIDLDESFIVMYKEDMKNFIKKLKENKD